MPASGAVSDITLAAAAGGDIVSILGSIAAGHQQQLADVTSAATTAQIGELNAELISQGSQLNAGVDDFNAAALDLQAENAITNGETTEENFRQQIKSLIGSQRASYGAQGVEVSSGSALAVQEDTAKQGELDALQIRTNAAQEAWGYTIQAEGERLQATSTLTLGELQSRNTLQVALAQAANLRQTGQNVASATNWGAASSILQDTASILQKKFA